MKSKFTLYRDFDDGLWTNPFSIGETEYSYLIGGFLKDEVDRNIKDVYYIKMGTGSDEIEDLEDEFETILKYTYTAPYKL